MWNDIRDGLPPDCSDVKIKRTDGKVKDVHFDRWFVTPEDGSECIGLPSGQSVTHWRFS